ncbi:MAG: AAA family ATPase [Candidatus Bathyarchaeia archaeon]
MEENEKESIGENEEENADYYYQKANFFYEHGEFEKAAEFYTKAIACARSDDPVYKYYNNRGLAYACLEKYQEAIADFLKVIELKPNFAEAWYLLGLAKEYIGNLQEAIEAYEKALELNPDFKDAQNRKELVLSKKRKQYSGLISRASSYGQALIPEQIKKLMNEGNYSKALELVEKDLRNDPDNFHLLLLKRVIVGKIGVWHELCGLEEIIDMIDILIINRIKNPDHPLYKAKIAQSSTGIILHGPPGCGKTSLTMNIAKQEGVQIIEVVISEISNMWAGESEKRLTQLFETAKEMARNGKIVIIFIDELDALGINRSVTVEPGESSWSRDLRNTLRRVLDEVANIPNIIVVGATNYLWSVDSALKRDERLGTCIIYVPPPDTKTRKEMFKLYARETPGHENIDYDELARITQWFSPADIKKICRKVHFEVARKIIKEGQHAKVATTEDYKRYIKNEFPTTLEWIRNVARAWMEGKIREDELDPRLIADINLANQKDLVNGDGSKPIEKRVKYPRIEYAM